MDDPKQINEQAYDHLADWYVSSEKGHRIPQKINHKHIRYLDWANSQESPRQRYTDKVLQNARPHPHILELGCGPGIPITKMLLDRGASVIGNDISRTQIRMATSRCPEAAFIAGDMATLEFAPETFDGITCFYAIFHLPREEQKAMLAKIFSWLKPGCMLVFNTATIDSAEIHGEMMGHGMFWSSYDVEGNTAMVTAAGFEGVEAEVIEAGEGKLEESDPDYGVSFLWISALKKKKKKKKRKSTDDSGD